VRSRKCSSGVAVQTASRRSRTLATKLHIEYTPRSSPIRGTMLPFPRRLIASLALGSTFVPTAARAELPEDCPGLGAALVDHSCFHSTHGPFATRLASPGTVLTADTPNLDPVHTVTPP
jgi:hypothetical protein